MTNSIFPLAHPNEPNDDGLSSVADLMSGLMIVFLAISIFFMMKVTDEKVKIQTEKEKIEDIAKVYEVTRKDIYQALYHEFKTDLTLWDAEINENNLSIRFNEPDILFSEGSSDLKPRFQEMLKVFFPRYIAVITRAGFAEHVREIRIEGHTSSVWTDNTSTDDAYLLNMELSQSRTRNVLKYTLFMPEIQKHKDWLKSRITANGLSSSQAIKQGNTEDEARSRRVEFRLRTDAEEQLLLILKELK